MGKTPQKIEKTAPAGYSIDPNTGVAKTLKPLPKPKATTTVSELPPVFGSDANANRDGPDYTRSD